MFTAVSIVLGQLKTEGVVESHEVWASNVLCVKNHIIAHSGYIHHIISLLLGHSQFQKQFNYCYKTIFKYIDTFKRHIGKVLQFSVAR